MKKQLVLNETELHTFINEQAKNIINEMKYNAIYNIVKKAVNETFDMDDRFTVKQPDNTNTEIVNDLQMEEKLRETIKQVIKETFSHNE